MPDRPSANTAWSGSVLTPMTSMGPIVTIFDPFGNPMAFSQAMSFTPGFNPSHRRRRVMVFARARICGVVWEKLMYRMREGGGWGGLSFLLRWPARLPGGSEENHLGTDEVAQDLGLAEMDRGEAEHFSKHDA